MRNPGTGDRTQQTYSLWDAWTTPKRPRAQCMLITDGGILVRLFDKVFRLVQKPKTKSHVHVQVCYQTSDLWNHMQPCNRYSWISDEYYNIRSAWHDLLWTPSQTPPTWLGSKPPARNLTPPIHIASSSSSLYILWKMETEKKTPVAGMWRTVVYSLLDISLNAWYNLTPEIPSIDLNVMTYSQPSLKNCQKSTISVVK